MAQQQKSYTLAELADMTGAQVHGDPDCQIVGVASLQEAQTGHITFLANPVYRKYLSSTQASAIILSPTDLAFCQTNALIAHDPYAVYARITHCFAPPINIEPGIHPSAIIGNNTTIHPTSRIEAQAVIGDDVVIGAHTVIGIGAMVGDKTHIGAHCFLHPRVTLYSRVTIGDRVMLHSGCVIGCDGFGFAFDKQQHSWIKIYHAGGVRIGDDVEIGANTTIDRGVLDDTIIERQVKIDNQVQIAHNVVIGAYTVIAGCVGIAGSAHIGKYVRIGGAACVAGHIEIVDNVVVTGMSMVTRSYPSLGYILPELE